MRMATRANPLGREKASNNLKLFRLIHDIDSEDNIEDLASPEEDWQQKNHFGNDNSENELYLQHKVKHENLTDAKLTNLNAFSYKKGEGRPGKRVTTGAGRHYEDSESDESDYSNGDGELHHDDQDDLRTLSDTDDRELNGSKGKPTPKSMILDDVENKIDRLNLEETRRINIGEPEYKCKLCSVTPHDHPFRPITDNDHSELETDLEESAPELYCELCLEETRAVPVSSYCVDCELYMCVSCRRYHWKILATRKHLVLSQQELLTRVYDKYMPEPETETPQEILENYSKVPNYPPPNRSLVNAGRYANDNIALGNSFCGPCLYENRKEEGTNFCYDCAEYLCRVCRIQHDRLAPTNRHEVVNRTHTKGDFHNFVPTVDRDTDYEGLFYGPEPKRDGPSYKPPDRSLSHVKGIGAQTNKDVNPVFISGSSFFADGKIILADYNNRRVKLYDAKYMLVSQLELPDQVADVVAITLDEAAVTVPKRKQLTFVHVDGGCKLHKHRTVTTVGKYWGIDFKHEELFALCVGTNQVSTSVHIMTVAGQLLNIVIPIVDVSTAPVLRSARYLTVSPTGGTIYISDSDRGVIAFGMDGRIIFTMQDKEMVGVKGLAVDTRNIYVCSSGSNCLHQVGYDGTCVRRLLCTYDSAYVDAPYTVSIDPAGKQLLVSMQSSDVVHMFSFG